MHSVSKPLSCCVCVGAWIWGWKKDGFKPTGSPFTAWWDHHNQQTFNSRTHNSTQIFPVTTLVKPQSQVSLFPLIFNQSSEQIRATGSALISKITFKFGFLCSVQGQCSVEGFLPNAWFSQVKDLQAVITRGKKLWSFSRQIFAG